MGKSYEGLGERIAVLRRQRGLSQTALAGRVGVTLETISRLERGVSLPSVERLDAVAVALGVPLWMLLQDEDSTEKVFGSKAQAVAEIVAVLDGADVATVRLVREVVRGLAKRPN